jgi:hypothetical protein
MVEIKHPTPPPGDYGTLITQMQLICADEQNDPASVCLPARPDRFWKPVWSRLEKSESRTGA